jgi:hypothetical protein
MNIMGTVALMAALGGIKAFFSYSSKGFMPLSALSCTFMFLQDKNQTQNSRQIVTPELSR